MHLVTISSSFILSFNSWINVSEDLYFPIILIFEDVTGIPLLLVLLLELLSVVLTIGEGEGIKQLHNPKISSSSRL